MTDFPVISGTFGLFIILISIIVLILWTFLPFAIFGIKPLLQEIINHQKQLIKQNQAIHPELFERLPFNKTINACMVCEKVKPNYKCKMTGKNINELKSQKSVTDENPCKGYYFKKRTQPVST